MLSRLLRAALVIGFVAAACGDDTAADGVAPTSTRGAAEAGQDPAEPPATSTTTAPLTDSFRGVTADTIKLGIAYMDLEAVTPLIDLD